MVWLLITAKNYVEIGKSLVSDSVGQSGKILLYLVPHLTCFFADKITVNYSSMAVTVLQLF